MIGNRKNSMDPPYIILHFGIGYEPKAVMALLFGRSRVRTCIHSWKWGMGEGFSSPSRKKAEESFVDSEHF